MGPGKIFQIIHATNFKLELWKSENMKNNRAAAYFKNHNIFIYLSLRKFYVLNLSQNCYFTLTPLKGGLLMNGFIGSINLLYQKIHRNINNNK